MSPSQAPRVMIVEDDPLLALDLEDILQEHGCDVVGIATRAIDAVDLIGRANIDVALIAFTLGDGDAGSLAKTLNDRRVPFGFCTGANVSETSLNYPHTPILGKPYVSEDVCRVVDRLIARKLSGT